MSRSDPPSAHATPFAGFWRRTAAFVVDGLILGLIGLALGLCFDDVFVRIGPWGRAVGFGVALVYFVAQEGFGDRGQSPGKRLLRIRVVDAQGRVLGPARGAARFAVLGVPWFLNGAAVPLDTMMWAGGVPFSAVVTGGLSALLYLAIFNRRTRQSLHDLAVGAFVVRALSRGTPGRARPWGGHLVIAAMLVLVAAVVPLTLPRLMRIPPFADLRTLYERLAAQPELRSVIVSATVGHTYGVDTSGLRRTLSIQGTLPRPLADDVPLSTRLAGIALSTYPDAKRQDAIIVRLSSGYDIGIASRWTTNEMSLAPDQWADRVAAGVGS
jgi:uncharacterized RDD family membrane protein YckC